LGSVDEGGEDLAGELLSQTGLYKRQLSERFYELAKAVW